MLFRSNAEGYKVSQKLLDELNSFEHKYILFDNDEAGKRNSKKWVKHGFTAIFTPDPYTDIAELAEHSTKKAVRKWAHSQIKVELKMPAKSKEDGTLNQ